MKALLFKGNIDYFDKAIQFIQPPRILLLGAVILAGGMFLLCNYFIGVHSSLNILWVSCITLCLMAFLFSIPRSYYNLATLKAMASLPKGMILMLGSLLKIKGANKQFIHTKHGAVKSTPKPH